MALKEKRVGLTFPAALVIVTALTYGIPVLLGWFGFYGDDWIYVYNNRLAGPGSFADFVRWDRPYSAWIYSLTGAVFGDAVLPYHLLILLQRIIAALFFYWTLRIVFPTAVRTVQGAALIFALYPGFKQQPVAVQFILHFASMDFSLISMWLMMTLLNDASGGENRARRSLAIVLTALSAALAAFGLFSCEYFTGWEFVRPFLIWAYLSSGPDFQSFPKRVRTLFRVWGPYLLAAAAFLYWRVFIFSFQTYRPKLLIELGESPLSGVKTLAARIFSDLSVVTVESYRTAFKQPAAPERRWAFYLVLLLAAVFLTLLFASATENDPEDSRTQKTDGTSAMILTGIAALIAAGIPFWATLLPIETRFPWDRSTIPFSFGAALLIAGSIRAAFRPSAAPLALAAVCALSIGAHTVNAFIYRDETLKLNDYFWQLAWRAPALQPGTTLISADIPLDRTSDNDLTPIVNWQYAPELRGTAYAYKYFDLHLRYDDFFASSSPGSPIEHTYRSHTFLGATDQVLALTYKTGSCLWTLTEREREFPGLDPDLAALIPISSNERIELNASAPALPPAAIGPEPARSYCYTFQRLRSAEQADNLEAARRLAAQLENDPELRPSDPFDYIPAVLAFAAIGNETQALRAAEFVLTHDGNRAFLCGQLTRTAYSGEVPGTREAVSSAIGCVPESGGNEVQSPQ